MKTSTRKKFGAALVIISLLVTVALYVSGTPLLSLQESHTTSSTGGAVMTVAIYKSHWLLWPLCLLALLGLLAFLWPVQKPPRLQS